MSAIAHRYEFVYLFDVTNGNPNGDPDAGNLPRLDPETNRGLVTDVALKRKIRNYVALEKENTPGYTIYMQEKSVLNSQHELAWKALNIPPDEKEKYKRLPKDQAKAKELTLWMCANFFDVRAFGAVMTTEVNTGQVRGPVQLAFASSVEPVLPLEVSITRVAVTNERDLEKERTMGRKHILPYGLYRAHGFVSAKLAERTGFSEDDLQLLWRALTNLFEHDRSAARGEMAARKLIVFEHEHPMGNAPAHVLFDKVKVERVESADNGPARGFSDYRVLIDRDLPAGVTVTELI
ncbi:MULTISPECIES: type I-C CRISPR-associated protein Cas7/Csd2 [Xanthomonas translucens group]|uniref:type I-C CRISPR-associated protein Cas7/Csd2 n=1 Tax=Xanthomonas translucens group TaxID=3390202 RepID=UPI0005796055|nr:type I-C CRISPR-associated protein Cas7/Csd2 [Xanthomonas translucens]QSQ52824.1 type I-C CRISPR-associated protein Cas7/Csd2 [Xanthomonas translucens pv. undulosa]QSQ61567.1 type I-C CRISPR-associated protein Cas7/Csd2 [Xanthomonas translucens pv. undulosa]UKE47565.1 type I-C CRISPR-associated protein Cas7/Csd2 [Xanthomonas translucens pv. cerealis]